MKKPKKTAASLSVVVGKNIHACRKRSGMTQNELAQVLGVEVETVSRYERGVVAPSFPQLEKISVVFNVAAWVLFSDGSDIPTAQDITIVELYKGLSTRDRDFIRSYVQAYAEHHQIKKKS
ncbi:MAG TPA: helix-turn-helix transcriptional regulator [Burkholderiaceae bacterium]